MLILAFHVSISFHALFPLLECAHSHTWINLCYNDETISLLQQLVIYETSASELDIIRDISRTFPSHVFFQQRHGPGQRSLYNVLKAYSVYDRDVGYVQGMGFLAGLLLLYMSEEDALWLLVALLKGVVHAPIEGLYQVGLPLVQQYLFQFDCLMKEHMPKLGEHFTQEMINPSMYASQWFITVFLYSFPFHLALRIWDVFLYEGVKIVFKVGLALIKFCHDDLVKLPFEKFIHALRNFPEGAMDPDTLLPMANSIKVSRRLEELKQENLKSGRVILGYGNAVGTQTGKQDERENSKKQRETKEAGRKRLDFGFAILTRLNDLMESKGGKKKSSSSKSLLYEAPLGYSIEDLRPAGGIKKFRSAAYSNVSLKLIDLLFHWLLFVLPVS
ncbi:hypothetical protein SADUNF_Sadunf17G0102800 [Salix dunnii]|uniref:Rab-GAP TBC domain-containing protein n=1 Tax=Salix dunnii TaxID=1413687 RepID=A0A835J6Y0_9ROSI|nr:hypothetical protein SADUNF_Sadunf17G0102800 [Salix dunnii]